MIYWTSACLLGFLGSFHCAVMCGPIVLACTSTKRFNTTFFIKQLVYNSGRISTYIVIGSLIGLLGKGLYLAGVQQFVSVLSGVLLAVLYFVHKVFRHTPKFNLMINQLTSVLRRSIAPYIKSSSPFSKFMTGAINGLLPCGLVYVAAAGALATGGLFYGGIYMLCFGLGTLPMMMFIGVTSKILSISIRQKINKAIPLLVVSMALLMVVRGMNLGIKYISPQIVVEEDHTVTQCGR